MPCICTPPYKEVSSDVKVSAYNAGDLGSIPRLGRYPREGNGNPLQYSCLENPPAMLESQVRSLDWEDILEKEMATHSSILAWEIPWTEEPGGLQSTGVTESDTTERLSTPFP